MQLFMWDKPISWIEKMCYLWCSEFVFQRQTCDLENKEMKLDFPFILITVNHFSYNVLEKNGIGI